VAKDGITWIVDVVRDRRSPAGVEAMIKQTAATDGYDTEVLLKQEPGSAGKSIIDHYVRTVLRGYAVRVTSDTQDKVLRADPFAASVENGNVRLVRGEWNQTFIGECRSFPFGRHDDQVDAAADAWTHLNRPPSHYVP
jgi:predicted phage terminase large subunit-like protein